MKICMSLLLGLSMSATVLAQDSAAPDIDGEVVVIADLSRSEIDDAILEIEEDFYRVFNAGNDDRAFDVVCRTETPVGTHFSQRVCEPNFLSRARTRNINDHQLGEIRLSESALRDSLAAEFAELARRMEALAQSSPQFVELAGILQTLRARRAQLENN